MGKTKTAKQNKVTVKYCEECRPEIEQETRQKMIDYLFEKSTAASAPDPWNLISIVLTKEEWQELKSGV